LPAPKDGWYLARDTELRGFGRPSSCIVRAVNPFSPLKGRCPLPINLKAVRATDIEVISSELVLTVHADRALEVLKKRQR
jgi:hypothetical protein